MTATINASTSAGVVTTADTSGILQLQTNGTAALTVDASQNVGIGTASPTAKLEVVGSATATRSTSGQLSLKRNATTSYSGIQFPTGTAKAAFFGTPPSSDDLTFGFDAGATLTEAMRIDSSGNVGIGTSSPKVRLAGKVLSINNPDSGTNYQASIELLVNGASAGEMWANSSDFVIGSFSTQPIVFRTQNTERARIDSSGRMLINTTTPQARLTVLDAGDWVIASIRTGTGGEGHIRFDNANGNVGYIQTTGTTTQYVTSSDYRLKNTIAPMTGALDKVALLKPCTYKWNVDGSDGQGFIAHELQEVVEGCVTGEKDAVQEEQYEVTPAVKDEEGNTITEAVMGTRTVPSYQGIDTSFLVATLTAAIQELKAIVDAQGAEIAALKGATA